MSGRSPNSSGNLRSVTEFHGGLLFIVEAGLGAHLAVIAEDEADVGLIGHNMHEIVEQVGEYLTAPPRHAEHDVRRADPQETSLPDTVFLKKVLIGLEHGCPHPVRELAEIIAHAAIDVLLDRHPDVRPAVATDALVWRPSMLMRGLSARPVIFSPTYAAAGV